MTRSIFLTTVFTLLFPVSIFAQCNSSTVNIYFANGIYTSHQQAVDTVLQLEQSYQAELLRQYPDQHFDFYPAYNPTMGILEDIDEVFSQRPEQQSNPSRSRLTGEQLRALVNMTSEQLANLQSRLRQTDNLPPALNWIAELIENDDLREIAAEAREALLSVAASDFESATNTGLVNTFQNDLDNGERVIIIAHSQGNLFTLSSVEEITRRNPAYASSIGIIGVATPSDRTPNDSRYFTAHDDRIINALRGKRTVLASNLDNDISIGFGDPRDWSNHYFLSSYFDNRLPSRRQIDRELFSLVESLEPPACEPASDVPAVVFSLSSRATENEEELLNTEQILVEENRTDRFQAGSTSLSLANGEFNINVQLSVDNESVFANAYGIGVYVAEHCLRRHSVNITASLDGGLWASGTGQWQATSTLSASSQGLDLFSGDGITVNGSHNYFGLPNGVPFILREEFEPASGSWPIRLEDPGIEFREILDPITGDVLFDGALYRLVWIQSVVAGTVVKPTGTGAGNAMASIALDASLRVQAPAGCVRRDRQATG